ncbi:MAG: hypothetical protein ACREMA_01175, partial [Longimicrobiales bacterium]
RSGLDDSAAGIRVFTDQAAPWSLGTTRVEASVRQRLGQRFGVAAALTAEGRQSTVFTSALAGMSFYERTGIDTIVRYSPAGSGTVREVAVPSFARSTDDGTIPKSANDAYRALLRADWELAPGTRIFAAYLGVREQERVPFGGGSAGIGNAYLAASQNATFQHSSVSMIGGSHRVGTLARAELTLHARVARLSLHHQSGLLDTAFAARHAQPALGFTVPNFDFLVSREDFAIDQALIERLLRNIGRRAPFEYDRTDLVNYAEFRFNPYGTLSQFMTNGLDGAHEYGEETGTYVSIAADLVGARHNARLGIEHNAADVAFGRTMLTSQSNALFLVEQPRRSALYLQDSWHWGAAQLDLGLRYDRFDPNSQFPVVPGYFNLDEPASYAQAEAQSALSPNATLQYNPTGRTRVLAGFSRSATVLGALDYYAGKNTDFFRFRNVNTSYLFSAPLGLERSTTIEASATHALLNHSFVQLAAYRVSDDQARFRRRLAYPDPTNPGSIAYLNVPTLDAGSEFYGATARMFVQPRDDVHLDLAYTFEQERYPVTRPGGTFENPTTERVKEPYNRHSLTGLLVSDLGMFGSALQGVVLGATARLTAGPLPLSYALALGRVTGEEPDEKLAELNLRLSRALPIGGFHLRVVIDARNVLSAHRSFDLDDNALEIAALTHRQTLGGGQQVDNINLASLAQAGFGVRNEVDLAALRQTERLFGNGDGIFSASEQMRAFTEAARLQLAANMPGGSA